MHVCLDISSLPYGRGVSRYTGELALALARSSRVTQLTLFGVGWSNFQTLQDEADTLTVIGGPKVREQLVSFPINVLPLSWKLTAHPQIPRADIYHSWDWVQPHHYTSTLTSTIHDLALLKFPDTAHPKIRRQHQASWDFFKRQKTRLIAVSETTKKDAIELLGYPNYLIDVVYEALPSAFVRASSELTQASISKVLLTHALDRPFILAVGTREPRKNLNRLIHAWQPLADEFDLVVAGEQGWDTLEIKKHAPKLLGRVSDHELAALYAEARCLAYPSLYEGFGLPILEAFHHGTPVVTSNASGMLEVAGNAAELVEPTDVQSIHQGLNTVLYESTDDARKRLQRMVIRSHMFNWDETASGTIASYHKSLNE